MKLIKIGIITILGTMSLFSCKENPKETTVVKEKITVQPTTTTEKKGVLERVGDAVDTRVNKEVNEEIEKIEK